MSKSYSYVLPLALSGVLAIPSFAGAQPAVPAAPAADPAAAAGVEAIAPEQDGIQVLDQGPVHEAFAEPVVLEAAKQIVVDRAPPDPVNELPPDVKPEGNNVQWISGYWMWSDLKNDFIWVSGVWRDIPPGRRWVPGHWLKAGGGFEWVPGFWAADAVEEVNLLPTPPDTLEEGPSSPAPGENFFWVPGVWVWQNGDYIWRAGYWYAGQPNWVWVPDHYCYTSYGAYYVNGYWDYPLASRGLLYAPVYYSSPIYTRPGYFYRPRSVVNTALLLTALFVNPYHSHYYYGYGGWGNDFYRPWWSWGWGGRVYDPFYSYHRWHDGRNHHDWHDHVRRDWDRHHHDWDHDGHGRGDWDGDGDRDGRGPRPDTIAGRGDVNRLVTNIDDFRRQQAGSVGSVRLRDLNQSEIQRAVERSQNWRQIREARTLAEADAAARAGRANVGDGNVARNLDRVRGGNRGAGGASVGGDADAQVGSTGAGDSGRRLRIDADGSPRAGFRLPPVERSGELGGQAGTRARIDVPGAQADAAARMGRTIGGGNPALRSGDVNRGSVNRDAIDRRFSLPNGGQSGGGQNVVRSQPSRVDAGRAPLPQSGNLTSPGSGNRIDIPRSNLPGRSFRYNPGQSIPGGASNAIEQRTFRVPSGGGGGSSIRIPSGGGGGSQIRVPSSGGGGSIRIPSGGGRSFSPPSGGSTSRSFSIPSNGGGQRSFSVPSGGGQRSFSIPSGGGGSQSIRVPSGGSSFRGFSSGGGSPSVRGFSGGGGGGQQMFRGGGGGGREFRGGGGGGGNRGGGGRGRGRD